MTSKKQRERQRANRRARHFEEKLDRKNGYGITDLTPYEAVNRIIKRKGALA